VRPATDRRAAGYIAQPIGMLDFVFAVAPTHPLAQVAEPLSRGHLQQYRAVVVADSARQMAPRTVGLLPGARCLSVPSMQVKFDYQVLGLGLASCRDRARVPPLPWPAGGKGRGRTQNRRKRLPGGRVGEDGAALRWWMARMREPDVFARLAQHLPGHSA